MEMPAPSEAANPTKKASQVLRVAKAAAKIGASVDTAPSINPANPGWITCSMELETRRFYEHAMKQVSDASTRKLLGDLAEIERQHSDFAATLEKKELTPGARLKEEKSSKRVFM